MKYVLSMFLVLLFVGCGNNDNKDNKDKNNPPEVTKGVDTPPPSIPKI